MSPTTPNPRPQARPPMPTQPYTPIVTYHTIRSAPFSSQDWAEASDADAPADQWDEAEYERQMRGHVTKVFAGRRLEELRSMCRERKLKVRGNKEELVERLVGDEVGRMYESGRGGEVREVDGGGEGGWGP